MSDKFAFGLNQDSQKIKLAVQNKEITPLFIVTRGVSDTERLVNVTAGSGVRNAHPPEFYASKVQKMVVSICLCITNVAVILHLKTAASILLSSTSPSSAE